MMLISRRCAGARVFSTSPAPGALQMQDCDTITTSGTVTVRPGRATRRPARRVAIRRLARQARTTLRLEMWLRGRLASGSAKPMRATASSNQSSGNQARMGAAADGGYLVLTETTRSGILALFS